MGNNCHFHLKNPLYPEITGLEHATAVWKFLEISQLYKNILIQLQCLDIGTVLMLTGHAIKYVLG